MSKEYTPTTDDVHRSYQCDDEGCATQDGEEFDRWLEGIREQSFRTGQQVGRMENENGWLAE